MNKDDDLTEEQVHEIVRTIAERFEGREAIYIEKGALRVRITNIRAEPRSCAVTADVTEIPTPGFEDSLFHRWSAQVSPLHWSIGTRLPTYFSEHFLAMCYGGWSLYFAPHAVEAVVNMAARWDPLLNPMARYRAVVMYLQTPPFD